MKQNRMEAGIRSARQRLEQRSQRASALPSSQRALVQEVLEAYSASVEEFQVAAEELQKQVQDGQEPALLFSLRDVTEAVEAEEALRQEIDRAQRYLDIAEVIIVAVALDQTVTQINRRGCEILGCEEESIVGKNCFEAFVPERDRDEVRASFEMLVTEEIQDAVRFESTVLTKAGEERFIAWHHAILRNQAGEIIGTVISGLDMTERRRAEERIEAVLRTTADGFWIIDDQGRIQDVNDSLVQMLGYSRAELLSMSVSDLEALESPAEVSQHIGKIKRNVHDRFDSQLRRKDGTIVDIEARTSCLHNHRGHVFAFIRDTTGRKQSERTREELGHALGERVKELNCLVSISNLVEVPGISLEEILKETVDLIPPAWKYPEVTAARLVLEDLEFHTDNFARSPWQQVADIRVDGEKCGFLQVVYLQERPESDEGPFLKEERELLNTIAKRMGEVTERTRAQQRALKQHQFVQDVLDSLAHPFYVINVQDHTVVLANSAAYTGSPPVGSTCYSLMHGHDEPCDREQHPCPLAEIVRTRKPVVLEHEHFDRDGLRRDMEVHGFPILDRQGEVVQMIEYTLDITERKQAELAQRESEARWRSLTETSPDHILTMDTDLRIQFANYASPGLTVDALIGIPLYTLVDEDRQAEVKTILENVVQTGEAASYETVYHSPDGRDVYYESRVAPRMLAGSEEVVGLTLSARDITARKQAEAALVRARDELEQRVQERTAELQDVNKSLRAEIAIRRRAEEDLQSSEERFRQLAENTDDVIWLTEPDSGRLLYVSPAYEWVWGRSLQSLSGAVDELWADVHPEDLALIPRDPVAEWAGKAIEFRLVPPDGEVRHIQARAFPVGDEMGQIYRLVCIASDITKQKETQAALIEAERLAIAGRMAASLGHEINNPLQAAIGCLELSLEQLDRGQDPHRHLHVTANALDRASRVVSQLRALHYPVNVEAKEESDLNDLLESVLVLSESRCRDQDIEVEWRASPDLPKVTVMPDAMQQVFLNLVLNAQDAMPDGGRLLVSTSRGQQPLEVQVEFADSGAGLSAEAQESIFRPFYTTKKGSLGLGLFISQNLVQQNGGRIEVQSKEGQGTTFVVRLPLQEQEPG